MFFFLLQTEQGDIVKVTLDTDGELVTEMKVKYFDTVPPANAMCILKTGFLFVASEFVNQQDSLIVASFVNATLILSETVEESTDSGFLATAPTDARPRLAALSPEKMHIQVYPVGIHHITSARTGG